MKTDLTGQLFGRLTVLSQGPKLGGRIAWNCLCSCGNYVNVLTHSLKKGVTQSCGCLHAEISSKDLTGQRYGLWAINSKTKRRSSKGYVYWTCICECGTVRDVVAESLLNGRSRSCGVCVKSKQFCIHGHDTAVWGRSDAGSCRACVRDKHLRTHYGITIEEFDLIYQRQNGKCAVCGKDLGEYHPGLPGWGNGTRIEVDHDHKKGKRVSVRGLLCGGRWAGCNRKLGKVDNVSWLENVIAYLKNPPAQQILTEEYVKK
jgi:hypothetical protein